MKYIAITFLLSMMFGSVKVAAQVKKATAIDTASAYYEKKDFKNAARFYDKYYIEQGHTKSNYDTYFAAVAAAHNGNIERANYYLKSSAEVGYDFEEYNFFADDPDNTPLRSVAGWKKFIGDFKVKADSAKAVLDKIIAEINDTTIRAKASLLDNKAYWENLASKSTPEQLIKKIKQFQTYSPLKKDNFWSSYTIKANDTLTVPFLVYVPKGYRPTKKTPLYIYLHGALINKLDFTASEYIPNGLEVSVMTKAIEQNAFIIYPLGKKDFGWLYQQQAFETVLKEVLHVKSRYNIDDNKIYIGGHSNGGSGAFWFALNKPSIFASFFGFNYLPKTYFGNTSLRNLNNTKTFYGISGSEDTTFPLPLVNPIYKLGVNNGANWKNYVKKGKHALPFYERDSINFIFDTLATTTRNPFPKKIEWETDNIKNGRNAWLEILELDTLAEKASWHHTSNPTVVQNGKEGVLDFNKNKSGAVIATVKGNTIDIQTSRVKRMKLYISADMFDLNQQLKLTINGKDHINLKLLPDKNVIVEEFLKTKDREFIVANKIEFTVN
jgi:predicted esterase